MSTYSIHEKRMTTWDGSELFYRAWLPEKAYSRAVILFHRGHEHSGRLLKLVEHLDLADFAVFAWDARGNGQSPGPRDWAEDFSAYVRDADTFVNFIAAEYQVPLRSSVTSLPNIFLLTKAAPIFGAACWMREYLFDNSMVIGCAVTKKGDQ